MLETQLTPLLTNALVSPRHSDVHTKIRAVCDAVGNMSKESQGPGYKFVSYDSTMQAIRPHLSAHRLRIKFSEVSCSVDPSLKTGSGKPAVGALVKIALYVIDLDTGEFDTVEASGYSLDVGDKAVAQAITIGKKYCLFDAFEISTSGGSNAVGGAANGASDDPDGRPTKNVRDDAMRNVTPPAERGTEAAPPGMVVQIRRTLARLVAAGQGGATEAAVLDRHAKGKAKLEDTNFAQAQAIDRALTKFERGLRAAKPTERTAA
jgi:hypothetical protein